MSVCVSECACMSVHVCACMQACVCFGLLMANQTEQN